MWRLILLLPLCSCLLTKALWAPSGKVIPEVEYQIVECEVLATRGALRETSDATRIAVDVVPTGLGAAVPHTTAWTRDRPGRILLRPPTYVTGWWFGEPSFVAEGWSLAVFGGAVFRVRGSFNARITMWGRADPEAFGRFVAPPDDLPRQPAADLLAPEWEWRARLALAEHDWGWLRTGTRGVTVRPRAWLDADGHVLDSLTRWRDPTGCCLIAELGYPDGRTRFIAISAAVLAGSHEQRLTRDGDLVDWHYDGIWWATHADAAGLPLFDVPLSSTTIAYEWGYDQPIAGPSPIWVAMKALVTPIAVALDAVIVFSPTLQRAVRKLLGIPQPVDPGRMRR